MLKYKQFLKIVYFCSIISLISACGGGGDNSLIGTEVPGNNINIENPIDALNPVGGDSTIIRQFNLSNTTYNVTEGQTISVTITRTTNSGTASISISTIGQSATHGNDYWGFDDQLVEFADGITTRIVTIESINDAISENDETFQVVISSPSGNYTLGSINIANVNIFDDDSSISNTPPTITGSPSTSVEVNSNYSFTPNTNDADNDVLTFSINNLPSWATFNATNGTITGIPSGSDIGTTSDIVISVTDGTNTVQLAAFNITVRGLSVPGSATLTWLPPTENVDGTALTDLSGYIIYYGTEPGNYSNNITINNPGLSEYVIDNLPGNNTYYFVITAFDAEGKESNFSNMASKTLP